MRLGVAATLLYVLTKISGSTNFSAERRLFNNLLHHYDCNSRPVLNGNVTVYVNFSIALAQILDLAEKNQTLLSSTLITEEWKDEILVWNPEDYDGLTEIVVPSVRLWLPDIYVVNNADSGEKGAVIAESSRVIAKWNGKITWRIPLIVKSSCAVDIAYFPYDRQTCTIQFSSWIYDVTQLQLSQRRPNIDLGSYVTNTEFELLSVSLESDYLYAKTAKYTRITAQLRIQRKPLYYAYTILAPTIVLSILTLFTFLLPCESGEKVAIGLTVFLSLYVLQLAIAENIPESNSLPLIGLFLTLVMTLNALALVMATLVMNIKKKADRKRVNQVPECILKMCKFIGPYLGAKHLNYYDYYDFCDELDDEMTEGLEISDDEDGNEDEGFLSVSPRDERRSSTISMKSSKLFVEQIAFQSGRRLTVDNISLGSEKARLYVKDVSNMGPNLKIIQPSSIRPPVPVWIKFDWFLVAEVFDKVLCLIYLTGLVLTIGILIIVIPMSHREETQTNI